MTRRTSRGSEVVTPSLVLRAYMCGIFPMADSADDPNLYWIEPRQRGVLPLDNFHVPKRLARTIRSTAYDVRIDEDFGGVIEGCAKSRSGRRATWINQPIRDLYGALFRAGQAHTVEIWEGDALVGGLYGVRIGAAFFGESMFSDVRDASKIALVHLAGRLRRGGFKLLDTQFLTEHLAQFGGIEVPRDEYLALLGEAIAEPAEFRPFPEDRVPGGAVSGEMILEALRAA